MTDLAFDSWLGHLPSHWIRIRFGQDIVINEGQVDPTKEPWSSMVLVAPNHIESGTGRIISLETARDQGADSGKYRAKSGQVLYSKIRPALNKVAIAPIDCLCSADMYPISGRHHAVDNRFIAYWILARPFAAYVTLMSDRVKMPKVNREEVAAAPWARPPLDEQRRIADFLDAETARIDQLANLRASQEEALGLRYQGKLLKMAQGLSDQYGVVKVRHVLQKIEQGWSPQCEDRPIIEGEWGIVKAGCVNSGTFDPEQHKALPAGTTPELRYRLRSGDLLMSRASGSPDLIGSIAVLPDDLPDRLLLCDKVYRLRMDRTRMSAPFVSFMLRTLQVREQIKLGISGAEGMANNLPTATITNLPLPDVPLSEQGSVVNELDDAWSTVQETRQKLREQLNVLAGRRQALITAAVTGGITV